MRNLDPHRLEFRQHFVLSVVTMFLVFLGWILLHMMPKYTNKFYYLDPAAIKTSDISTFKIMAYLSDVLLIVSWVVASIYNKAAVEGMDLDPEEDDDNKAADKDEEGTVETGDDDE